jgi:hypothetical protein
VTHDSDRSIAELELEIARTRVRLAGTADALAAEFTRPRVIKRGMGMLNGFRSRAEPIGFGGGFRADPVGLALIGLGAAWLVAENTGLLDGIIPEPAAEPAPMTEPAPATELVGAPPSAEAAGEWAGEDHWFHQAASATQGALRQVYDRGSAVIGQAGGFIADPAGSSGRIVARVEGRPLLLGLLGIAAGAIIAMLLPTTRREREIAAQVRDDLWERAEELSHRAANSMRDMADDVAHEHRDC